MGMQANARVKTENKPERDKTRSYEPYTEEKPQTADKMSKKLKRLIIFNNSCILGKTGYT